MKGEPQIKTRNKVIAAFCVLVLLVSPLLTTTSAAEVVDLSSKIDTSFLQKISSGAARKTYRATVWLVDIDHDKAEAEIELTREEFTKEKSRSGATSSAAPRNFVISGDSVESLDEFQVDVELKRQVYSDLYSEHNRSICDQLLTQSKFKAFAESTNENASIVQWQSSFAPVVKMLLTKEQILQLAESDLVCDIYDGDISKVVDDTVETQTTQTRKADSPVVVWQRATNANTNRDNYGYDGTGVKVGILDCGVLRWSDMDTNEKSVFTSIYNAGRLVVDPNVPTGLDNDHATLCASIIASGLSAYKGLAPNVTLYSSDGDELTGGDEQALEWLISKGVNVINCSVGWDTTSTSAGTYSYMARYLDHIYVHHDATIVLSVGNKENGATTPPGSAMSYNSIVVGASNDNATSVRSDDTYSSCSLYSTSSSLAVKPDVVAPGETIVTAFGTAGGTSVSAPQVTAIVAQLFTQRPSLKTGQTLSKAIIMASIGSYGQQGTDQIISPPNTNKPALHQKMGAGEVDANGVRYIVSNYRYVNSTFTSSSSTYTKMFSVTSSDTLMNVALVWQKNNRMTGSHSAHNDPANPACPKLKLEITAPNGTKFTSYRTSGNVQMLTFVPIGTGTYTIKVTKMSAPSSEPTVTFALAWR